MLILINIDTLVMVLDLMNIHNFYGETIVLENILWLFGANISSSVVVGNIKHILVLGEGMTQKRDDTAVTAEAKYPKTFT